ncbi:MAG TPA: lysylphosphatidylglycerol synthase domain-containing protein [Methylomirabilota bacterium]|nr:lysylphosphatidylglycerol synthase domain-containing protein [Methylomirabilota bacterium]
MRFVKPLLLVAGAIVLAVLVHRIGAEPILNTLRALTWWQFVLICLPYGVIVAVDTLGWRFAFARDRAPFWRLYGARLAGEALNVVTAVGSVGGEAVKAWLVRRDVSYAESVPSIVIAKTTIVIAQAIFLLVGIGLAWTALDVSGLVLRAMLWLLVVEVLAVGGFFGAQIAGLVGRGGRVLVWAGVTAGADAAEGLDRALRHYYRHEWRRFALSTAFHVVGWLMGALEAALILWLLGVTSSVVTATVIEALGSGVRFASFMVPASLGAFEGANAAAFGALGFGAGAGLAFSFVRRARQTVWIVVGLLVLAAMRWREARDPRPSAPSEPRSRPAGRAAAAPDDVP